MIRLSHTLKLAALAASVLGTSALAGCAPGYYGRDGYYRGSYYRHDRTYDRDDDYRRDNGRHWVCDSDGDNCRWTYDRD
ncbi:MAG: hypothetical protein KGM97_06640 [Alphaproteobacteria bacterium]|nr:hypothetical protein [Alphaproteobacteria bacterium]MDE2630651.1 hypothetical protein [Alphaproteobacteria bacterium]